MFLINSSSLKWITYLGLRTEERFDVDGSVLRLGPQVVVPEASSHPDGGEQSRPFPLAVHHGELHVGLLHDLVGPAGHVGVSVEDPGPDITTTGLPTVFQACVFVSCNKVRLEIKEVCTWCNVYGSPGIFSLKEEFKIYHRNEYTNSSLILVSLLTYKSDSKQAICNEA